MKRWKKTVLAALALVFCAAALGASAQAGRTIAPVAQDIDVARLPDGVYRVSFDRDDVRSEDGGVTLNGVRVYTRDRYDAAEVDALRVGDGIVVEGEAVEVLTLARDAHGVTVNEGQDARAFYLVRPEAGDGYIVRGMNDLGTYTEQGVAALRLAEGATFTDGWDIGAGPVTVDYDGIAQAIADAENDVFIPDNTALRVENGAVTEIVREYML